jgi:hypothetical protein
MSDATEKNEGKKCQTMNRSGLARPEGNTIQDDHERRAWIGFTIASVTVGTTLLLTAPFVFVKTPLPYMVSPAHKIRRALHFSHHYILRQRQLQQRSPIHTDRSSKQVIETGKEVPSSGKDGERISSLLFVDLGSGDGEAVYQAIRSRQNNEGVHSALCNDSCSIDRNREYFAASTVRPVDFNESLDSALSWPLPSFFTHAIGIEINYTLYLVSQIRRWCFWSRTERERSTLVRGDFLKPKPAFPDVRTFKAHPVKAAGGSNPFLRHADVVYLFGVQPLMKPLSMLLANDCRPGTLVLSYRFRLPLADGGDARVRDAGKNEKKEENCHGTQRRYSGDDRLLHAQIIYDHEEMRIYECLPKLNTEHRTHNKAENLDYPNRTDP